MRHRCRNPKNEAWHRYGGRGITVCERWDKFENFIADMGPCPPGLTLDRENNDGNYEPGNCRWATSTQQNGNRCDTNWITHSGKTMCAADWARYFGLTYNTFMYRYRKDQIPWAR